MVASHQDRPEHAEVLTRYDDLERFVAVFGAGHLNAALILGLPGLQKSRLVADTLVDRAAIVRGQASAYGLYATLFEHRDRDLVLDDLDGLFADPDAVRLLKCLLETGPVKELAWRTRAAPRDGLPASFRTRTRVLLITNRWRTLNTRVAAVEDRCQVVSVEPRRPETRHCRR
jgi:hypothetical protein